MKNIMKRLLIGERARIVDAKNRTQDGIEGTIIDETKNTVEIETTAGRKKLIKKNITLALTDQHVAVSGELLVGRPEERIKKKTRNN